MCAHCTVNVGMPCSTSVQGMGGCMGQQVGPAEVCAGPGLFGGITVPVWLTNWWAVIIRAASLK